MQEALSILTPSPTPGPEPDDLEQLGERIAEISAQITAATYQLLLLLAEFDRRDGWNCGFSTCAHWLSWRTGLSLGPAREHVRVARALTDLPRLSEAMRHGRISYSKVRALTRVATPENEEELLLFAMAGTASHVERLVRAWRRVDRIEEREQEALRHASRSLDMWTDEDGMVVVRGRLDPEAGAALIKAVEAGCDLLYQADQENEATSLEAVPVGQRRADALGRVAEAALAGGLDQGTRGDRYQVVVHVDEAVLEEPDVPAGTRQVAADRGSDVPAGTSPRPTVPRGHSAVEDGGYLTADTAQRLACDACRVVMTHDAAGNALDVGRKTRIIPPAIRRALAWRDQKCRFPGCEASFCDAHHVLHWARGGETSLDNLVLLCRKHHRCVHEGGYRVRREDGELRFLRPDGRPIPEAPPLPARGAHADRSLPASLAAAGVDLEQMPAEPEWDGSAPDLGLVLEALRGDATDQPAAESQPS